MAKSMTIEDLAGKMEDLTGKVDDLTRFIEKRTENMATKDDLKGFATKDDLVALDKKISIEFESFAVMIHKTMASKEDIQLVRDDIKRIDNKLDNHEKRINNLEGEMTEVRGLLAV